MSFFTGRVLVASDKPTPLTVVVVVALSDEAYHTAFNDRSLLEQTLFPDGLLLRQGYNFAVNSTKGDGSRFNFRLEMLEPVFQGCGIPGKTKIILVSSPALELPEADDDDSDEHDAIEIDEGFLGHSVLNSGFDQQAHSRENTVAHNTGMGDVSLTRFSLNYLDSPQSLLDDHCTLYLRTADLGRLGVQSGDWAVAAASPLHARLVRIVGNDGHVDLPTSLAGSPLLLRNLIGDETDSQSDRQPTVCICPSPFGSHRPAIPTARTVTIARVASPVSTNRQYQQLFLDALKIHLESGRRLVKQGDLLAVSIDTDLSRWLPSSENGEDAGRVLESSNSSSRILVQRRPNEAVFFKVTNIEYDVVSQTNPSTPDAYTGSTLGELGCWIDSSVTKIVQTGIEHSRVPDLRSYMRIDRASALTKLQGLGSSHLLGPKGPFSRLLALSSAAFSQRAADYRLNLTFLLKGGRGVGKYTVASWVAQRLGLHILEVDCYDILGESEVKSEATLRVRFEQAKSAAPCLLILRHLEGLSQTTQAMEAGKEPVIVNTMREVLDDLQSSWKMTGFPVIVVGTTSENGRVPAGLLSCFKQEIDFEAPNEGERLEILRCLTADHRIASDVSLQSIAIQTAALLAGDLRDLVALAAAASLERAGDLELAAYSQVSLTAADFEAALIKARDSYSESIGAPKIPTVSWDDVGGLAHVKSDILDTIQLPLEHPELFADGLKKRSGILLYGPPGTGKTLIAKAVATSCSLNFFSVKGPELLNMYIGESEANVRRVFQRARDAKPCVIFFDELDSVAPKRGNHGDSGGVMDRIVSQLLAELDGMSGGKEGSDVFVIGATNRPDLLDPALLRPGRFDRMLYLGVSDTHKAQLNILEALTRKFRLDPELKLGTVAEKCPFNYTGADFYALCSDAMLNAMSRKAEEIEEKITILNEQQPQPGQPHPITPQYYLAELASPEDILVYVTAKDFDRALQSLVPSVSKAEMEHYAQVQERFSQKKEEGDVEY